MVTFGTLFLIAPFSLVRLRRHPIASQQLQLVGPPGLEPGTNGLWAVSRVFGSTPRVETGGPSQPRRITRGSTRGRRPSAQWCLRARLWAWSMGCCGNLIGDTPGV